MKRFKSYSEKLRDPKWQKKRLQIMERDEFRCRLCGCESQTLNVHHAFYMPGAAPWEYEDHWLATFCEPCHEIRERHIRSLLQEVSNIGILEMVDVIKFAAGRDRHFQPKRPEPYPDDIKPNGQQVAKLFAAMRKALE